LKLKLYHMQTHITAARPRRNGGQSELPQQALRVMAILFFLSLVVFAKFHEPTRFAHALQKLAHPVTFGVVALLFLTLLRRQTPRRLTCYVVAFALTVLCGAGTEVAQAFVNRPSSTSCAIHLAPARHLRGSQHLCRARMPAGSADGGWWVRCSHSSASPSC
jgi:hypothetical protein